MNRIETMNYNIQQKIIEFYRNKRERDIYKIFRRPKTERERLGQAQQINGI
jgi:hypothetical protein